MLEQHDGRPQIHARGTIYGPPRSEFRYMHRRRIGSSDRNGDPLGGMANLFTVAIVLAIGIFITALTAAGLSSLLTNANATIIANPGTPEMRIILKQGGKFTVMDANACTQTQGVGTLAGSLYKLADGSIIYVPAGATPPTGGEVTPGQNPTAYPTTNPYGTPTPSPTASEPAAPGGITTPTPGVTASPATQMAPGESLVRPD